LEQQLNEKRTQLAEFEKVDYRAKQEIVAPEIEEFWQRWQRHYGQSGFVNPRGDRLLTELTIRAIEQLRPKLVMVNYNTPGDLRERVRTGKSTEMNVDREAVI